MRTVRVGGNLRVPDPIEGRGVRLCVAHALVMAHQAISESDATPAGRRLAITRQRPARAPARRRRLRSSAGVGARLQLGARPVRPEPDRAIDLGPGLEGRRPGFRRRSIPSASSALFAAAASAAPAARSGPRTARATSSTAATAKPRCGAGAFLPDRARGTCRAARACAPRSGCRGRRESRRDRPPGVADIWARGIRRHDLGVQKLGERHVARIACRDQVGLGRGARDHVLRPDVSGGRLGGRVCQRHWGSGI